MERANGGLPAENRQGRAHGTLSRPVVIRRHPNGAGARDMRYSPAQAFEAFSRKSCDMAVGWTPATPFAVAVR